MQIEPIDSGQINLLAAFLAKCGSSLKTFRYFSKRPLTVIDQHLVTLLGLNEDGDPVAYGHLDVENESVWLGICIAEREQGRGYGHQMMEALVAEASQRVLPAVRLTVDDANGGAVRLYEQFGFELEEISNGIRWYRLRLLPE